MEKEMRRSTLHRQPKATLIATCKNGVKTPEGKTVIIEGGMHPIEKWSKTDIIASIMSVEFPQN